MEADPVAADPVALDLDGGGECSSRLWSAGGRRVEWGLTGLGPHSSVEVGVGAGSQQGGLIGIAACVI